MAVFTSSKATVNVIFHVCYRITFPQCRTSPQLAYPVQGLFSEKRNFAWDLHIVFSDSPPSTPPDPNMRAPRGGFFGMGESLRSLL